jgi:phosphoenolpyruvate carboxykinase (GTP)
MPSPEALDIGDLELERSAVEALLRVDRDEWHAEVTDRDGWLRRFGEKLPAELLAENEALRSRLGTV